jgi:hypothetical protein
VYGLLGGKVGGRVLSEGRRGRIFIIAKGICLDILLEFEEVMFRGGVN